MPDSFYVKADIFHLISRGGVKNVELPTAQEDETGDAESGAFLLFWARVSGNLRRPFHILRSTLGLTSAFHCGRRQGPGPVTC